MVGRHVQSHRVPRNPHCRRNHHRQRLSARQPYRRQWLSWGVWMTVVGGRSALPAIAAPWPNRLHRQPDFGEPVEQVAKSTAAVAVAAETWMAGRRALHRPVRRPHQPQQYLAEQHLAAEVAGEQHSPAGASAVSPAEESAWTNRDHWCSKSCDGIPRVTSIRKRSSDDGCYQT